MWLVLIPGIAAGTMVIWGSFNLFRYREIFAYENPDDPMSQRQPKLKSLHSMRQLYCAIITGSLDVRAINEFRTLGINHSTEYEMKKNFAGLVSFTGMVLGSAFLLLVIFLAVTN